MRYVLASLLGFVLACDSGGEPDLRSTCERQADCVFDQCGDETDFDAGRRCYLQCIEPDPCGPDDEACDDAYDETNAMTLTVWANCIVDGGSDRCDGTMDTCVGLDDPAPTK